MEIRHTVAQQENPESCRLSLQGKQGAVGNALSDMFTTATAKVEIELEKDPCKGIKMVLIDIAKRGALDEIFDLSIDHYTNQHLLRMCSSRALISLPGMPQATKCFKMRIDKTYDKWFLKEQAEGFPSEVIENSWPQPPASSSCSNENSCQYVAKNTEWTARQR